MSSSMHVGSGSGSLERGGSGLQGALRLPAVGAGGAATTHPTYASGSLLGAGSNASPLLTSHARTLSSLIGLSLPSSALLLEQLQVRIRHRRTVQ